MMMCEFCGKDVKPGEVILAENDEVFCPFCAKSGGLVDEDEDEDEGAEE